MIKCNYAQNFKCFEEILAECRALNLLTGINGMGKTTIIQALLFLRQTVESLYQGEKVLRF